MTLLDAKPPKPVSGIRKYVPLPTLILIVTLVAVIVGLVSFRFRNVRQERAVSKFLETLEQENYQEAYRLWQPAKGYSFSRFVTDWGEHGDYGKIRKFEILGSDSEGSRVTVTVRINDVNPPLDLWVERDSLGLAYAVK